MRDESPPRRRLRFSTRWVLAVTTLLAVAIGWPASRAVRQQRAVQRIEAVGGVVHYDWQEVIPDWGHLYVRGDPPGPEWARRLLGPHWFDTPKTLFVATNRVSVADLEAIAEPVRSLRGIQDVYVHPAMRAASQRAFTAGWDTKEINAPAFAAALASLPRLRMVNVQPGRAWMNADFFGRLLSSRSLNELWAHAADEYTLRAIAEDAELRSLYLVRRLAATDAGAEILATNQSIERLHLNADGFGPAGFQAIGRMSGLRHLQLDSPRGVYPLETLAGLRRLEGLICTGEKLSAAGLGPLRELPNLETLSLRFDRLSDEDLAMLSGMDGLRGLSLAVTDEDGERLVEPLGRMTGLTQLRIDSDGTPFSAAAEDALVAALPNCRVRVWPTKKHRLGRATAQQ